jgi:site-specific recombinase XerD
VTGAESNDKVDAPVSVAAELHAERRTVSQGPRRWSITPPNPSVLMLRTDGRLLVVEEGDEPRWRIGIGEKGVHPVTTDPGHLQLVDIDAVVQLVASQLVRVVDIAQRAGVSLETVRGWRDRYRDFPAPVVPGLLWYWPHLVAVGFDRPQPQGRRGRTPAADARASITLGELAALFEACAADLRPYGRRDAALLALLSAGGLRCNEALQLDVGDYDPATGTLHVTHGKRHQKRTVYLDDGGRAALNAWLEVLRQQQQPDYSGRHPLLVLIHQGGRLSRSRLSVAWVKDILYERALQARVARSTAHDLRRALGGNLPNASVDLSTMTEPARLSGWPPSPGVLTLRTDAQLLVVEQDGEPRSLVGIGEKGLRPVTTDSGHLQLVDMDALVQLVGGQLLRIVDIANRVGVPPETVGRRLRYRDDSPAPVAPGPLWWWPHLVAAGFDRPQPWGRRGGPNAIDRPQPRGRRGGANAIERDLEALLAVDTASTQVHGRRNTALLTVLHAGLSYTEAIDVDLDDYDAATGALRVTHGRRPHQFVDLDGSARATLAAWVEVRRQLLEPDQDGRHPLFVSIHPDGRLSPRRLTISGVSRILSRRARQAQLLVTGEAVAPRRSKAVATVLGVAEEQLPAKLRQLKGGGSYEALARELAGRGVQVGQRWLWRYLNPEKGREGRRREREARNMHVSDIDKSEIAEGEAYQLSIRHPDGSTQQLDISAKNYRDLKLEGLGKMLKKRGRKPGSTSRTTVATRRRGNARNSTNSKADSA